MGFPGSLGGYGSKLGVLGLGVLPDVGDLLEAFRSGLVAHFPLNESTGTTAEDIAGTHTGTFQSAPTRLGVQTPGGDGAVTIASGNFITTTGTINIATGAVELWFKITANPAGNAILAGLYDSASKTDKVLFIDSSGKLNWRVNDGSAKTITTTSAVQLNRWHHAVGIADGTHSTLFYDGAQAAQTTAGNTISNYTTSNLYIAGGTLDTWAAMPGSYDEVAVLSSIPTSAQIAARYAQGIKNITTTQGRLTEYVVEAVRGSTMQKARLTEMVVEVPHASSARQSRVTQMVVEVLRSSGNTAIGTGTGGFTLGGTASESDTPPVFTYNLSGSGGFTLGGTASEGDNHIFNVSGSGGFTLGGSGRPYRTYDVEGSGGITLAGAGWPWRTYDRDASGGFTLTALAAIEVDRFKDASGGFTLGGTGHCELVPPPGVVYGSASGGFTLGGTGYGAHNKSVAGVYQTIRFTGKAVAYVTPIHVSASGGFSLSGVASESDNGPRPVSAAGGLTFTGKATATKDAVACASGWIVFAGATRTARDWHVSATSTLTLSGTSKPRALLGVSASSGISFSGTAAVVMTATQAAGGFTFTDLATAVVWFPWRNTSLALPPGGGLPHS